MVYILFFIIAMIMAVERNRSEFGWFFVALFFTPLIAILLLFVLGNSDEDVYYVRDDDD